MVYPAHVLIAWGGTLHGGEQWANSVRMVPNDGVFPIGEDELENVLPGLQADLTAHYNQPYFHTGLKLNYVKANKIAPNGRYASSTVSHTRFFADVPGAGTQSHPAQVACVVTLMTGASRGLANKGRMYMPGLALGAFAVSPADGRINVQDRDAFANHCKVFLNNLNNFPGVDGTTQSSTLDVHVVSKGGLGGPGIARKVTGVRVGRVLDTQRRRREDLAEDYSAILPVT